MRIKEIIKRIIYPETYNQEAYISSLKKKYLVDIGDNCRIWEPKSVYIDTQRPHMLHIGSAVKITRGVTILAHDFSRSVFCNMPDCLNAGEAKETWIGDNVFIGMSAIILMGAHIGDNSIVGAGAVVTGQFPDGVVLAGNPAKVICSIEDFYRKRRDEEIQAAQLYVEKWRERFNRDPSIEEMTDAFAWLYLPHTKDTIQQYSKLFRLGGVDQSTFEKNFLNSSPVFSDFEVFLQTCKKESDT